MTDFKDLDVWKRSRALVSATYRVTASFPPDERFRLTDQLLRAAASILANIAEGNGRLSPGDQARFYRIALGSAREVQALLIVAQDQGFGPSGECEALNASATEVQRMLFGLLRYCDRRRPPPRGPSQA